MLRRLRWTRGLLLACLGIALAEAIAFAGIGFVEYARKQLLLNPAVVQANDYDNYFRVNSLFFDPNIYGRFLAVVMIALTTLVMWSRRRRDIVIAAGVALWLLAGMVTSFSQSSIAAFAVGLAVIAAYRWNVRETLLVCVGLLAVAGLVLVFAPSSSHLGISGTKSANNATSGRATLVDTGLTLFAHRPLEGYGPGSFPTEYLRHNRRAAEQDATSASHTIPVTIAAEQGVIGLAVYVALLIAAFGRLFAGARGSPERIAIAACFGALVLHTMTYADFLEDPTTWALLAIGAALALGGARVDADADPRPDADVDVDVAQVTPASAG
jgi:O-antigen ligase